ncbi:MAG: DUF6497 family protein [Rhodobacteraceae bacterium]|jgi:hypothetical protein|nr:DUF6497 family protein [Paracoccaceae bacterium]
MMRAAAFLLLAAPAWAAPELPSGLAVEPFDRAVEVQPGGERWLVLRYLAPGIADLGFEAVAGDLDALCQTEGLPAAAADSPIAQVVVVLMDRPVERGVPDPEATQFIGAYLIDTGACEWE